MGYCSSGASAMMIDFIYIYAVADEGAHNLAVCWAQAVIQVCYGQIINPAGPMSTKLYTLL